MSTKQSTPPEWPGFAGWFGLLLAMVWLIDPASFTSPLPAVTLVLAAGWLFGLYRHVRHTWGGDTRDTLVAIIYDKHY